MSPWTITIIGGLVVGVVVFLITRGTAARGKVESPDNASGRRRKHLIEVGKHSRVESGGVVQAGDGGSPGGNRKADRQHAILVRDKGTIIAQGDVVAGDTKHPESGIE